jgi:hypothetical protein
MKKTALELTDKQAWEIYPSASKEIKSILEVNFGKNFFSQKITDRVKTVEDLLAIAGKKIEEITSPSDSSDEVAYKLLKLLVEVLNEGWTPDWDNGNQYKWYPYFDMRGAGFGFSHTHCAYWHTRTSVGSRLCFKSDELAKYAGTQFSHLYKDFLTIEK